MSSPVTTPRNRDQWLSVAQFLGGFVPAFDRAAASLEAASDCVGADCALSQPLPDGNHGENLNQAQA
jgi:hypothetical protein